VTVDFGAPSAARLFFRPWPEKFMTHRAIIGLMAGLVLAEPAVATENTLADRLAAAQPEAGEQTFKHCRACHTNAEGGENGIGPNLWGVVGRPVASVTGFAKYSDALRATGGDWTPERIDAFLTNPHEDIQGTRMPFVGLDRPRARADLIAYLNLNSPQPLDLKVGADIDAELVEDEPAEFGVFFVASGVDEAHAYCTACHSERLVAQQGLDREDWVELIEWMVDEQGMAEIDEPDFSIVLDYLTVNYNTDRPNFPNR
jgi:cytochrome c